MLRGERFSSGSRWLAINIHRNFATAREFFPRARFIHLVRDPRDCARSAIGMGQLQHGGAHSDMGGVVPERVLDIGWSPDIERVAAVQGPGTTDRGACNDVGRRE